MVGIESRTPLGGPLIVAVGRARVAVARPAAVGIRIQVTDARRHDGPRATRTAGMARRAAGTGPSTRVLPVVALVGRPNVGKSTFLGRACRRFVETANAPGTTVGAERRRVTAGGRAAWLVDLPGTRGLLDEPDR